VLKSLTTWIAVVVALACYSGIACADHPKTGPVFDDPAKAEKDSVDYRVQGTYTNASKKETRVYSVQIVALGKGKFVFFAYPCGFPGEGWNHTHLFTAAGKLDDKGEIDVKWGNADPITNRVQYKNGVVTMMASKGGVLATLKKVTRKSPTLGKKPPKGAVVLFDGTALDHWRKSTRMTKDGLLKEGAISKDKFQSHTLHVEFRLPFMPEARGQARGNSGLYVQGRYEIQMLDSFDPQPSATKCGGIYGSAPPAVNMCYPPLTWQTYDVEFTAPKFDESGKKIANARMTVHHNGVLIHDDVEIPRITPGGCGGRDVSQPGPIFLQNHHNPVRYRNIWVVPHKEKGKDQAKPKK